jgi:hypothetical protein
VDEVVAQRGRVGAAQRQRCDADAHEQVAQLGGQRADHPFEVQRRQMRTQQVDQAVAGAGPCRRQMADLDDAIARRRRIGVRRQQRLDRRIEIAFEKQRARRRAAIARRGQDAAVVTQAGELRCELPHIGAVALRVDPPDECLDLVAPRITHGVDGQARRDRRRASRIDIGRVSASGHR